MKKENEEIKEEKQKMEFETNLFKKKAEKMEFETNLFKKQVDVANNQTKKLQKVFDASQEEVTCSICLGLCVFPVVIDCGHTFCERCIHEYFEHASICPFC